MLYFLTKVCCLSFSDIILHTGYQNMPNKLKLFAQIPSMVSCCDQLARNGDVLVCMCHSSSFKAYPLFAFQQRSTQVCQKFTPCCCESIWNQMAVAMMEFCVAYNCSSLPFLLFPYTIVITNKRAIHSSIKLLRYLNNFFLFQTVGNVLSVP